MKNILFATMMIAGVAATGSAFAAQTPTTAVTPTTTAQAGQWVPPYGDAVQPKTREQVYQELVHAEKDGQLSYLNSTLYSHG